MLHWLRRVFHKSRAENDLDRELRFHLDQLISANLAAGMTPEQARRDAAIKLGGVERVKQEVRDNRWEIHLDNFVRDVGYALRNLRKDRRFALIATIVLALGIGASTAIFSVVDAALLRPLPYRDPSRLVSADEFMPRFNDWAVPNPEYSNWKHEQSHVRRHARLQHRRAI